MSREKQDATQTKVFTRWVNMHLKKKGKSISDLIEDVKDGQVLCQLLEILTGEKIKYNKKPKIRVHLVENCTKAIDFILAQQYTDHHGNTVNIKLTNISGRDIVDAKKTLILGLIFTIISRLQVSDDGEAATKEGLIIWVHNSVKDYGLKCTNLHKDWCNGKLFAALVSRYRNDLLDFPTADTDDAKSLLGTAFDAAEKAGIEKLLDVEDLLVPKPDEKSVYTQVLQYFLTFASGAQSEEAAAKINGFINVLARSRGLLSEYEKHAKAFLAWCETATETLANIPSSGDLSTLRASWETLNTWRSGEKISAAKAQSVCNKSYQTLQGFLRTNNRPPYVPSDTLAPSNLASVWSEINSTDSSRGSAILTGIKAAEDALRQAFADAADAFVAWTSTPTETLNSIKSSTEASATRLTNATELVSTINDEGTPLFDQCSSAQDNLDSANITENTKTTHTLDSLTLSWSSLKDGCSSLVSRMEKAVKQDSLRQAFADAADTFVAWLATPRKGLVNVNDVSTGSNAERCEAAATLKSKTSAEGEPLFTDCTETNSALEEAGIVSNAFTSHNYNELSLLWGSIKGEIDITHARLAKAAANDTVCQVFADAANKAISWFKSQRAALSEATTSEAAQAIVSSLSSDGPSYVSTCQEAQEDVDAADIDENPFTSVTAKLISMEFAMLTDQATKRQSQLALHAKNHGLCVSFANAANDFMTWTVTQKESMAAISGTPEERLSASQELEESINADGTPLFSACSEANDAFLAASLVENTETNHTMASIGLEWNSLTDSAADLISSIEKEIAEAKRLAELGAAKIAEFEGVFKSFDKDRSGTLEFNEFSAALKALGKILSDEAVEAQFKALDDDRSGTLSKSEFVSYMINQSQDVATEDSINKAFVVIAGEGSTSISSEKLSALSPDAVSYFTESCPTDDNGNYQFAAWSSQVFGTGKSE